MSSGTRGVHVFDINVRNHALLFRTENEFVLCMDGCDFYYNWNPHNMELSRTHPYSTETVKTQNGDRREN